MASNCFCGSTTPFAQCCQRLHQGRAATTAAELMRARYSAFVCGDVEFLRRSWAPETRPAELQLDPDTQWTGLEILATTDGGPFHREGTVHFIARYRHGGVPGAQEERSRFRRDAGTGWVYLDGVVE